MKLVVDGETFEVTDALSPPLTALRQPHVPVTAPFDDETRRGQDPCRRVDHGALHTDQRVHHVLRR